MKIKNTLLALSTATVVALAGAGAATAADTTDTTDTVVTTQDETSSSSSSSEDGESTGSSASDFFGWDEDTEGAEKFEDVTGVIGKVFEFFGKIVGIFI